MRAVLQILERIISNKQKKKTEKLSILHRLLIYESHIYMLRIFFSKKTSTCPSYQLQLEAYCILLHPKLKIKFYTCWNPNWLIKDMSNCLSYLTVNLYLCFLFHDNNSVTINKFKKWITMPACFRNGKVLYSTLVLNFNDWPFGVIVTGHIRAKSAQNVIHWGVG